MATRKATFNICDAPGCYVENEVDDQGYVTGFIISKGSYDDGSGGGPIPKTYACCPEHIGPAIAKRIEDELLGLK